MSGNGRPNPLNERPVKIRCAILGANGREISGGDYFVTPCTVSVSKNTRAIRPNPLTPTSMVISRAYRNAGKYRYRYSNGATYVGTSAFVDSGVTTDQILDNSDQINALRLKSRSKFGSGEFNAGQVIAELPQSVRMIADALKGISDMAAALRRGSSSDLSKLLGKLNKDTLRSLSSSNRLADGWLSIQYGWVPLVNDAYGAAKQIHQGFAKPGQRVSASTGTRPKQRNGSQNRGGADLGPLARRAKTTGIVTNPGLRTLQQLGLLNPAALAWNRLPYSFVADWALPIGTLIGDLSATAGMSHVWTSVVTERRVTTFTPRFKWMTTCNQTITRGAYSESIVPAPASLQKLYAPSAAVAANAVALLAQQFNRNHVRVIY